MESAVAAVDKSTDASVDPIRTIKARQLASFHLPLDRKRSRGSLGCRFPERLQFFDHLGKRAVIFRRLATSPLSTFVLVGTGYPSRSSSPKRS